VKRLLVTLILATCFLVGCGGQDVKLENISFAHAQCQEELVGRQMYWAIWTIKPSKAVTIDRVALTPTEHPKVRIVKELAETRNAGAIGGQPWPQVKSPSFGAIPKGHSFDGWLGIRPATHLRIALHEQVTFGLVIKPLAVGVTNWKGLEVYFDGTSTLIPTTLGVDAKTKIKGSCTLPNPA
jgi:hypothetical protein